jgi:hypothetical protein
MKGNDMSDDLEAEKWRFAKGLFSVVMAQQVLICGLSAMQDQQWRMLKLIGEELGVDMPEPPQIADPAALAKMAEGIRQLEAMFDFTEGDEPVN